MFELTMDPIIENYIKFSRSSQEKYEMPVFSETLLRIAFKHVFGKFRRMDAKELSMYRKLLLYYYSEEYPDVTDLLLIMNCYTEADMNEIVAESESVVAEWQNFLQAHVYSDAQRQTFVRLLCEWCSRYKRLNGKVDVMLMHKKAEEFRHMLGWNKNSMNRCLNKLRTSFTNPNMSQERNPPAITVNDLNCNKIAQDLLPLLSPLFRDKLRRLTHSEEEEQTQSSKRVCLEKVELLQNPVLEVIEARDSPVIEILNIIDIPAATNMSSSTTATTTTTNATAAHKNINATDFIDLDESMESDEQDTAADDDQFEIFNIMSESDDSQIYASPSKHATTSTQNRAESPIADSNAEIRVELIEDGAAELDVIDSNTAMNYLAEVHTYALLHGHYEAGELLQRVTSLLSKEIDA